MKCVILAAGTASRLKPLTDTTPKCLLPVGGSPILHRAISWIAAAGIDQIGIVIGFRADQVRAFVKQHFPFLRIRFIVNPKYEITNNAFSLLMAREFYLEEEKKHQLLQGLLLLDGDIVFDDGLLPHMLSDLSANRIAVRVDGEHDEEEVRVKTDALGNVLEIGKRTPLPEAYGESIGIEFFTAAAGKELFRVLERRVRSGPGRTEFYEASFQAMLDAGVRMKAIDISAFPAVEIDTSEDLLRAERLVRAVGHRSELEFDVYRRFLGKYKG